jgi:hypothetical protein
MRALVLIASLVAGLSLSAASRAANIFADFSVNGSTLASIDDGGSPGIAFSVFSGAPELGIVLLAGGTGGGPGFNASVSGSVDPNAMTPFGITVRWTQVGVPTSSIGSIGSPASIAASLTTNGVLGGLLIEQVTIRTYVDPDNQAFGTSGNAVLFAERTFTQGTGNATNLPVVGQFTPTGSFFSETVILDMLIVASPNQSNTLAANIQFFAVAAPEPMALTLFGAALIGLGVTRRVWRNR